MHFEMLLKLKHGCASKTWLHPTQGHRDQDDNQVRDFPTVFRGTNFSFNLGRMSYRWICGWNGRRHSRHRKGEGKKGEKSLWICSSCTSMRLNSANNQQEERKERRKLVIRDLKVQGRGDTLFSFRKERVPFPVLFLKTISTLSFH